MTDEITMWSKDEKEQLIHYSERVERILDEIEERNEDMKAILADAKDAGFNPSTLKKAIKRKRDEEKNPGKFDNEMSTLDFYYEIIDSDS